MNKKLSLTIIFTLFLTSPQVLLAENVVIIPFKKTNIIPVVGHSGSAESTHVLTEKTFGNDASENLTGTLTGVSNGEALQKDVANGKTFSNYNQTNISGTRDISPKVAVSGQVTTYSEIPNPNLPISTTDGGLTIGASIASVRFIDNNDGTVLDTMTGLKWLKNANCFGALGWTNALNAANALADGQCDLISSSSNAGDWRIPNILELQSIISYEYMNPTISNSDTSGKWTSNDPFTNIKSAKYHTSTTSSTNQNFTFSIDLKNGLVITESDYKDGATLYVWPVRN
ncbi:MAG: DUF1566 domain-containing protein [Desulfobulbaceae bacterium]|nr:DUF1566 domain-containing protein [Desulfobulbaceae bacterium]